MPLGKSFVFSIWHIIFYEASTSTNVHIQNILTLYGLALGQQLNREKTELLFSRNVDEVVKSEIKYIWGVQSISNHKKYLDLPTFVGRSKYYTFKIY